jgi:DnaK suppressor protein
MSAADLKRFKSLLLEKQRELMHVRPVAETYVPAACGWEGDLVDQANADAEADLQIRLHQSEGRLSRAIEDALARIQRGTYGFCSGCNRPISKSRLEAVPWTHLCRECKEQRFA